MTTSTTSTTTTTTSRRYVIDQFAHYFNIFDTVALQYVTDSTGVARRFTTRSSARKAVTRLNRPVGDRHR